MAYLTSKGNRKFGDITFEDDADGNTKIDFDEDRIDLVAGGAITFRIQPNTALMPSSAYINFNTTTGATGYGIRENAGSVEYKHSGGSWTPMSSGGVGSSPAGNNKEIQFNTSGSFASSATLVYDAPQGRVGIGTSAPSALLHVSSSLDGDVLFQATPYNQTNDGFIITDRAGATYVTLNKAGQSTYPLDVNGNIRGIAFISTVDSPSYGFRVGQSQHTLYGVAEGNTDQGAVFLMKDNGGLVVSGSATSSPLRVQTPSNANILVVSGSGNVGIGTSAPLSKLDVSGKIAISAEQASTPTAPAAGSGWLYTKTDGKLYWQSGDVAETDVTSAGSSVFDAAGNFLVGGATVNASSENNVIINAGALPTSAVSSQSTFTSYEAPTAVVANTVFLAHCEDSTVAYGSGTISLGDAASFSTAKSKFGGSSLYIDGTDLGPIIMPAGSEFDFSTSSEFTIEFWYYPVSASTAAVFTTGDYVYNSNQGSDWLLYGNGRLYDHYTYTAGFYPNMPPGNTGWHHVVIQRYNSGIEFYLNGTLMSRDTSTFHNDDFDFTNGIRFGSAANGAYQGEMYIDEILVMSSAKYTGSFVPESTAYSVSAGDTDPAEMWVGDGSNNLTKISPHNREDEWEFFSRNIESGKVVRINLEKTFKRLEELHPGETFIEEFNIAEGPVVESVSGTDPPA